MHTDPNKPGTSRAWAPSQPGQALPCHTIAVRTRCARQRCGQDQFASRRAPPNACKRKESPNIYLLPFINKVGSHNLLRFSRKPSAWIEPQEYFMTMLCPVQYYHTVTSHCFGHHRKVFKPPTTGASCRCCKTAIACRSVMIPNPSAT